jgi:hypothetical protein
MRHRQLRNRFQARKLRQFHVSFPQLHQQAFGISQDAGRRIIQFVPEHFAKVSFVSLAGFLVPHGSPVSRRAFRRQGIAYLR